MAVVFHAWYNKNELTAYPLDGSATKMSDSGELLPDDILVDAHIQFPDTLGQFLVLSSLTVSDSLVTATFAAATAQALDDPEPVFVPLCAVAVPKPFTLYRNYAVQPMAAGVAGWVVFGNGANVAGTRSYLFTRPKQSTLCQRAAHRYPLPAVTSLGRVSATQKLIGDVRIRGRGDLVVEAGQRQIADEAKDVIIVRLDTSVSADAMSRYAGPCGGRPETGTCNKVPIRALAGVTPDCDGNINIIVRAVEEGSSSTVPIITLNDVPINESSLPDGTIVFESVVGINDVCPAKDEPLPFTSSSSLVPASSTVPSSSALPSESTTCPPLPDPYCEAFDNAEVVACYWDPIFGTWVLTESSSSIIASSSSAYFSSSVLSSSVPLSSSSWAISPPMCAHGFSVPAANGTYSFIGFFDGAPIYQSDTADPWFIYNFVGTWVVAKDPGGAIWFYRDDPWPGGEYMNIETRLADGMLVESSCSSPSIPVISSSSQQPSSSAAPVSSSLVPVSSSSQPSSSVVPPSSSARPSSSSGPFKNIILILGDGMGEDQIKAASLYYTGTETGLSFQALQHIARVNIMNETGGIPDSAAAGTALFTGERTSNGAVSERWIVNHWESLPTMLEVCKGLGMRTGLVTTSYLTDATPACLAAHNESRWNTTAIASVMLNVTKPNVMFGGGGYGITPIGAYTAGYDTKVKWSELSPVTGGDYVAGLFGNGQFPYPAYRGTLYPTLTQMAMKAIELLENRDAGFFLLIENELTDNASESSDLSKLVVEVKDVADVTTAVLAWAAERDDTLVVVLADHETGGLRLLESNGIGVLPTVHWETAPAHSARAPLFFSYGPNSDRFCGNMHDKQFYSAVMDAVYADPCASSIIPAFGGSGLVGRYYNGAGFDVQAAMRIDPQVFFDWGSGSPDPAVNPDNFSARWLGEIVPRYTEQYFFYTKSDDGIRLYVNDVLVIDNWTPHGGTWDVGYITLTAGEHYDIRVEYFEVTGDALIKLYWASTQQLFEAVPVDCLFVSELPSSSSQVYGTGLFGAYFSDLALTLPRVYSQVDPTVDFTWPAGPSEAIPAVPFSVRWTGNIITTLAGTYTFYVTSAGYVRVWVNDVLVLNHWSGHSSVTDTFSLTLTTGEQLVRIEYANSYSTGVIKLEWELSGQITREVVPQNHLVPLPWNNIEPVRCHLVDTEGYDTPVGGVCLEWQYGNTWTGTFVGVNPDVGCRYRVHLFLSYSSGVWSIIANAEGTIPNCPMSVSVWSAAGSDTFPPSTPCGEPEPVAFTGSSGYGYLEYACDSSCSLTSSSSLAPGCPAPGAAVFDSSSSAWVLPSCSSEAPAAIGEGDGLLAEYYDVTYPYHDLKRRHVKVDTGINFAWTGDTPPEADVAGDYFRGIWRGFVQAKSSEWYQFNLRSNHPVRLYVNGELLVDNWVPHAGVWDHGFILLDANQFYSVLLEYDKRAGDAFLILEWETATVVREVVPQTYLYTPGHPAEEQDVIHVDVADNRGGHFDVAGALLKRVSSTEFYGRYAIPSTGDACAADMTMRYQGGAWLLQITWPGFNAYTEVCSGDCAPTWEYSDSGTGIYFNQYKQRFVEATGSVDGFTIAFSAIGTEGNPPEVLTSNWGTATVNYGKQSYTSLRLPGPLGNYYGGVSALVAHLYKDTVAPTDKGFVYDRYTDWCDGGGETTTITFEDGFWVLTLDGDTYKAWAADDGPFTASWFGPGPDQLEMDPWVAPLCTAYPFTPYSQIIASWEAQGDVTAINDWYILEYGVPCFCHVHDGTIIRDDCIGVSQSRILVGDGSGWRNIDPDHYEHACGPDLCELPSRMEMLQTGSIVRGLAWNASVGVAPDPGMPENQEFRTCGMFPHWGYGAFMGYSWAPSPNPYEGPGACSGGSPYWQPSLMTTPYPQCVPPPGYNPLTDEQLWHLQHPSSSSGVPGYVPELLVDLALLGGGLYDGTYMPNGTYNNTHPVFQRTTGVLRPVIYWALTGGGRWEIGAAIDSGNGYRTSLSPGDINDIFGTWLNAADNSPCGTVTLVPPV